MDLRSGHDRRDKARLKAGSRSLGACAEAPDPHGYLRQLDHARRGELQRQKIVLVASTHYFLGRCCDTNCRV